MNLLFNSTIITVPYLIDKIEADLTISEIEHKSHNYIIIICYKL